jgi:hypothetical protein
MTDAPAAPNPYAAPEADIGARARGPRSPAGLRVTAGVLLILAAVVNLVTALGYAWGGATDYDLNLRKVQKTAAKKATAEGRDYTPAETAQIDAARQHARSSAKGYLVFAGFLALTVVASIVAAVSLFQGKRGRFILFAALLVGGAEMVGGTMGRLGWINGFGLLAAGLAAVAGVSILRRTG